jgi:hypothetical protein
MYGDSDTRHFPTWPPQMSNMSHHGTEASVAVSSAFSLEGTARCRSLSVANRLPATARCSFKGQKKWKSLGANWTLCGVPTKTYQLRVVRRTLTLHLMHPKVYCSSDITMAMNKLIRLEDVSGKFVITFAVSAGL